MQRKIINFLKNEVLFFLIGCVSTLALYQIFISLSNLFLDSYFDPSELPALHEKAKSKQHIIDKILKDQENNPTTYEKIKNAVFGEKKMPENIEITPTTNNANSSELTHPTKKIENAASNLLDFFKNNHLTNYRNFFVNIDEFAKNILNFAPFAIFFNFIFFFIIVLMSLVFQLHIALNGLYYVLLASLLLLLITLTVILKTTIVNNTTIFLELEFYSLYMPEALTSVSLSIDKITASFMFLVVCIACSAVAYSRVYLQGDPNTADFLIKLCLFVLSMLLLVLSKNFILLYFAWEMIGVTSAWLINYNSQKTDTVRSTLKAFTFNKLSDLCLFASLLIGYWHFGASNITEWELIFFNKVINGQELAQLNHISVCAVLMLIAASIKSAQIGFHLWLPDSMDAPVPASALIHSATLVSAGVYLLLRFNFLFVWGGLTTTIILLGAVTSAYGGVVASTQTNLKKALAYSTISHCGFLFVAAGLGGVSTTLCYLFLHGFFKALSFICAGEAIRTANGYQDINKSGGLFFSAPNLSISFFAAMANLCGLPFFLGYSYKMQFQLLFLTKLTTTTLAVPFLLIGLLSSLVYFCKIFWSVCCHYKKNNYKSNFNMFKKSKLNYSNPVKNPKVIIFIFWNIYFFSWYATFKIFNTQEVFTYFDTFNYGNSEISCKTQFINKTPNVTKNYIISYFFYFYSLFAIVIYNLIVYYAYTSVSGKYQINKLSILFLFFLFLFLFL